MKIKILCVGKIKEKFYREAIDEYKKRLSRYANIEIVEVEDEKTEENISATEINRIKDLEGKRLLSKIKENDFVICLAIEGKKFDSVEFSDKLSQLMVLGKSDFCFVIGGSLGISELVLKKADMLLSFSDFTFPHQLMRVILLEQIYRSFRIMNHEPYHK